MAIDTAAKRHSIRHLGMPWRGPAVVPSGTVDQGERQTFLNYYSGILWAAVVDPTISTQVGRSTLRDHTVRLRSLREGGGSLREHKPTTLRTLR